ncbi:MAG: ABC transporter permease [Idiomarina sp.]|nr:ABC transporter permease [Idiomarina sp.]
MLLTIARKSLLSRRTTVIMTLASLVISLTLLFAIEHLREQTKSSFHNAVSGTDLIVGARSGQLNLLLYSVFRVGNPTANVGWDTYERIAQHPRIRWTVPIALGDSHRGYSVVGTTQDYFTHFRYSRDRELTLAHGKVFDDLYDAVIGSEVARALNYQLGDEIVLAHGTGSVSFVEHDDKPFTIVGILAPTGTPVDQSIHISLEGMEAIHVDWQSGAQAPPGQRISADEAREKDLTPTSITAFLVGIDSRAATFLVQRQINTFRDEALSAIIPGVAMAELWRMLGSIENLLLIISGLVLIATLVGLTTTLLASMKEREREIAILRATGARPWSIFWLIQLEVVLMVVTAIIVSIGFLWGTLLVMQQFLVQQFGILIETNPLNANLGLFALAALAVATLMACIPAFMAYRTALSKGLTPRI